jgi:hypothetical protein
MNARKHACADVLDPFDVETNWFQLELSFMQVVANPQLDPATRARVQAAIAHLNLNDEECRRARALYYDAFLAGDLSLSLLMRWSPFVASEAIRQGLIRPLSSALT